MSEENKKLTEEELKKVQDHQGQIGRLVHNIGVLEAEKHAALHMLAGANEDQEKTKKELEEKYGSISVNISDGSYEEVKKEEVEKENE